MQARTKMSIAAATTGAVVIASPAVAAADDNNNFGSDSGLQDTSGIQLFMGDSFAQDWSVNTLWYNPSVSTFDDTINLALEGVWEPTDLSIARGARNTVQDVIFVPVADMGPAGLTLCDTQNGTIAGAHHHRECDRKIIFISMDDWDNNLNANGRKHLSAHEFGHAVGMRHSDVPVGYSGCDTTGNDRGIGCGTDDSGNLVELVHDGPLSSVMQTFVPAPSGCNCTITAGDTERINTHY